MRGLRLQSVPARRLREEMGEMIDDVEMDVRDEDEEMKEWEEAQIPLCKRVSVRGKNSLGAAR
jgi:hypothetical protein